MNKQEIINGLRLHAAGARPGATGGNCEECPYYDLGGECVDAVLTDAYFLLQQPAPAQISATGTEQLLHETQDLLTETLRDVTETINSLNIALATLRAEMRPQNDR